VITLSEINDAFNTFAMGGNRQVCSHFANEIVAFAEKKSKGKNGKVMSGIQVLKFSKTYVNDKTYAYDLKIRCVFDDNTSVPKTFFAMAAGKRVFL
jgi:hypothetical protein